ncbi:hypothetical protein E2C01_063365 [Portunus trituberculatus]|uniref:Uncharacterized protein n=1 Tax=Portunus trituberculatus TaxID=210409 RepID=A0A5B7HA97_PORTR|nr:hypothetical protein [Portunus trituberculatus]
MEEREISRKEEVNAPPRITYSWKSKEALYETRTNESSGKITSWNYTLDDEGRGKQLCMRRDKFNSKRNMDFFTHEGKGKLEERE